LIKRSLTILDCNDRALSVYGYLRSDILGRSLQLLFADAVQFETLKQNLDTAYHERMINIKEDDTHLYVNVWISPAQFVKHEVLIMTVVDITAAVETEEQLIQAGKMATLGEMATGVAHELNQPLVSDQNRFKFYLKEDGWRYHNG
jgi:histidine kinase